jgi:hypothetical protein
MGSFTPSWAPDARDPRHRAVLGAQDPKLSAYFTIFGNLLPAARSGPRIGRSTAGTAGRRHRYRVNPLADAAIGSRLDSAMALCR